MYIVFIRTVLLYLLVILIIRLMGKRQVGELQPYELVITMMLADLATLPMQDTRLPLLLGIIPIVTLLVVNIIITEIQLKSVWFRKLVDGEPYIIINNGKINMSIMKKQRLTIDDILEQVRLGGYLDIDEIQFGILENNGSLSLIPKSKYDMVKKEDLNIYTDNPSLPLILYAQGKINENALLKIHKNIDWLDEQLKNINAPNKENLYLIMLNSKGNIYYQENIKDNIKDSLS